MTFIIRQGRGGRGGKKRGKEGKGRGKKVCEGKKGKEGEGKGGGEGKRREGKGKTGKERERKVGEGREWKRRTGMWREGDTEALELGFGLRWRHMRQILILFGFDLGTHLSWILLCSQGPLKAHRRPWALGIRPGPAVHKAYVFPIVLSLAWIRRTVEASTFPSYTCFRF